MAALLNSAAVLGGVRLPTRRVRTVSAKAAAPVAARKVSVAAVRMEAKAAAAVAGAHAADAQARCAPAPRRRPAVRRCRPPQPCLGGVQRMGGIPFSGEPIGRSLVAHRTAGCVASVLASGDARAAELVAAMPQEVRTKQRAETLVSLAGSPAPCTPVAGAPAGKRAAASAPPGAGPAGRAACCVALACGRLRHRLS
jgi:hypothetical protein